MSNKDMPEGNSLLQKTYDLIDRVSQSENIRKLEQKIKEIERRDLKDFTRAALQGLCSDGGVAAFGPSGVAKLAIEVAEAALSELEGRG
jgi:hypothetical protein